MNSVNTVCKTHIISAQENQVPFIKYQTEYRNYNMERELSLDMIALIKFA